MNRFLIALFLMMNLAGSSLSAMELRAAATDLITFAQTFDKTLPTISIKQVALMLVAQMLCGKRYDDVAMAVRNIVKELGKTHKELVDEIHDIVQKNDLQTVIDLGYYSASPCDESIFAYLRDNIRAEKLSLFLDSDEACALLAYGYLFTNLVLPPS